MLPLTVTGCLSLAQWQEDNPQMLCDSKPQEFNSPTNPLVFDDNVVSASSVYFQDDETITLKSWRRNEGITLLNFALNTNSSRLSKIKEKNPVQAQSLCMDCENGVLSTSPNKNWNLIWVKSPESSNGIWLMSDSSSLQIIDWLPYDSQWVWSIDSTQLWFQYSEDSGSTIGVISLLDSPLAVAHPQAPAPNQIFHYAFSPVENVVLATSVSLLNTTPDNNHLYTLSLANGKMSATRDELVKGVEYVDWDEGSNNLLIIKIIGEFLEIHTQNQTVFKVPFSALEQTFWGSPPTMETETRPYALFSNYSISPSRKRLMMATSDPVIYIFECRSLT